MDPKNLSQITFDFSDATAPENASVGIRVKSIKQVDQPAEETTAEPAASLETSPVEEITTRDIVAQDILIEVTMEDDGGEPPPPPELAPAAPMAVTKVKQPVVKKSTRGRKSLKALDAEADLVNIPPDEKLFQRQYYSIGEVAEMFGVNQSLLRFWENEFDIIQPRKNRKGDRHFRPIDIKNLELIYDLLRRRKLTIEGAKDFLKKNKQSRDSFEMIQSLQKVKEFLLEIKASL